MPAGQNQGKLRIIGGMHRSRKILFQGDDTLRPTPDRLRETLFNWLQPRLRNAVCLDAFAGSGILGLEALSRGAAHCTFIDNQRMSIQQIKDNCEMLRLDKASYRTWTKNALKYLSAPDQSYDIIFADPPFHKGLLVEMLKVLTASMQLHTRSLTDNAVIYIEHAADENICLENLPFEELRSSKAGQTTGRLLQLIR